jgi:hypothetical protein
LAVEGAAEDDEDDDVLVVVEEEPVVLEAGLLFEHAAIATVMMSKAIEAKRLGKLFVISVNPTFQLI